MRGLGQIAWLASFARPDDRADHEHRPGAPRARRDGRERRPGEGRADRGAPAGRGRRRPRRAAARALPRPATTSRSGASAASSEPGRFRVGERTVALETSYRARHQLDNTLAALDRLRRARRPAARAGALEVDFGPLREEVIELPGGVLLLNDCYNANPLSMRAALAHLAELAGDAPPGRGARRDGRARRRRRAALPPRGRRRGRRSRASSELVAVGELAARVRRERDGVTRRSSRPPTRRPRRSRELLAARRRRARQGLARGGTRGRRGEAAAARWHASSSQRSSR